MFEDGITGNVDKGENGYYLVNTGGNIQKSKMTGVKDGNDCYYYVNDNRCVVLYTDNKTLKTASEGYKDDKGTTWHVKGNNAEELINGLYPSKDDE